MAWESLPNDLGVFKTMRACGLTIAGFDVGGWLRSLGGGYTWASVGVSVYHLLVE